MNATDYKLVIQWSEHRDRYEAYSPTLSSYTLRFAPEFPRVSYGATWVEAVENYINLIDNLSKFMKKISILPPSPDVGSASTDCVKNTEKVGKMVL